MNHDAPRNDPHGPERFAVLWTDYLEGQLDPAGMAELDALLAADEGLLSRAADFYQTHRRLGLVAASRSDTALGHRDRFVADVMARLPADGETLTRTVMERIASGPPARERAGDSGVHRPGRTAAMVIAASLLAAAVAVMVAPALAPRPRPAGTDAGLSAASAGRPVRFSSLARARFLDRATPPRQAIAARGETYVLSQGLVQLDFPCGATAILEAPAAFRVCGEDCLAVDAGSCSVHAPEAAEGFRIETPATRVIDRGTRFVLRVDEAAATRVRVIEGAADLVTKNAAVAAVHHLTAGETARHDPAAGDDQVVVGEPAAEAVAYQRSLPDRIVAYAATRSPAAAGAASPSASGIDELASVVVQRGGICRSYRADQLIGVRLLHFRAGGNPNNLAGPITADDLASPRARRDLLEADRLLTTGLLNPGGSAVPLAVDPVLTGDQCSGDGTPGLAVAFSRPVINSAGPDVVYFDLQVLTDPPEGDAFHVGPLRLSAGLRTATIDRYDIDSTSPESQLLAAFRLYALGQPPGCLADLLGSPTNRGARVALQARAHAVGIDLSDLGYPEGGSCAGLFFQDAADDDATIDPVFIAGLPPLVPAEAPAETGR